MRLIKATEDHIQQLVTISQDAFHSDIEVGGKDLDGPPGYDSVEWYVEMMHTGHLYTAMVEGSIVGSAILFGDEKNPAFMYIGRIFIAPEYFRRGYGIELMNLIEKLDPNVTMWCLDTPAWNLRTNRFYKKLGYIEKSRNEDMIMYQKGSL